MKIATLILAALPVGLPVVLQQEKPPVAAKPAITGLTTTSLYSLPLILETEPNPDLLRIGDGRSSKTLALIHVAHGSEGFAKVYTVSVTSDYNCAPSSNMTGSVISLTCVTPEREPK